MQRIVSWAGCLAKRQGGPEAFEKIVLREGLSRVADVQPGDFDSMVIRI